MQLRRRGRLLVLALVFGLLVPVGAAAIPLLDQEQPSFDLSYPPLRIGGPLGDKLAQTFTVGMSGVPIEIQLPVQCESGMLIVEIFPVEGGLPSPVSRWDRGVKLAADLPPADPPVFRSIPLEELPPEPGDPFPPGSPSFFVEEGTELALVLSNPTGTCTIPRGVAVDPYTRGHGFYEEHLLFRGWARLDGNVPPSDDLPFRTVMDAEPEAPACEVIGIDPDLPIPPFVPVCRCVQDASLRETRCAFLHPDFFMIRRIPFPIWPGDPFEVSWTLLPLTDLTGDVEVKEILPSGVAVDFKKPLVFRAEQVRHGRPLTLEYKATATGMKPGSYVHSSVIVAPGAKKPEAIGMRTRLEVTKPK